MDLLFDKHPIKITCSLTIALLAFLAVINFIPLTGDEVQPSPPGRLEKGAKQLDILMPNVTIPAKETSYLCTHVQLPDDKKYHIIARQVWEDKLSTRD